MLRYIFAILTLSITAQTYNLCSDITLSLTTQENAVYTWFLDGQITSTQRDNTIVINATGNYTIELEVLNEFGCSNIDKRNITVNDCLEPTFYVPNAISPNGENNTWFPVGENIVIKSVLIFTRDGQLIFDALEPWDGRYNSRYVQGGVYAYKISYEDLNGRTFGVTGRVTVVY